MSGGGARVSLAIVIVTYNGEKWIRGVLDSLRASRLPCVPYVVDNASADATAAIVEREYPEAKLLRSGGNLGFGRGNNLGIARALREGARYIFLLNQDAYVLPDTLGDLVAFLDGHPEFGVATPLHCSPGPGSVDRQTMRGYLSRHAQEYLSDACVGNIAGHYEIAGINAAAWMVRAEVFRTVGGFDPLFFMYGEDDDLLARFRHFAVRMVLLPGCTVVHLREKGPQSTLPWYRRIWRMSERERSDLLMALKLPAGSAPGKFIRLLLNGIARPILDWIDDHDHDRMLSRWLACGRLVLRFGNVMSQVRLCRTPGPHFLES